MKYRCQTPLRADEFDLRPELLRRREASKDPVSSQQGDQLLSVASDLRNLVYNSAGDKAARSASFQAVRGQTTLSSPPRGPALRCSRSTRL